MEYTSYRQAEKVLNELLAEQNYEGAIELLVSVKDPFPNDLNEILWQETKIHAISGEYENCLTSLEDMSIRGFFLDFEWIIFDPIRDEPRFKAVSKAFVHLKVEAQKNAQMEYRVYTPDKYTKDQQYPLFIALHGDGEDLECFQRSWKLKYMLNEGFIVVYIQSSQVLQTDGFWWTNDYTQAQQDIQECFEKIVKEYSIDVNSIICGGYSGGAMASLNFLMNDLIPFKGIVALCPNRVPDTTEENIKKVASKNPKIVIIEGELSEIDGYQEELIGRFKKYNIDCKYVNNKNHSHKVPNNFFALTDAIQFIMK